jgi:hypothetical protein
MQPRLFLNVQQYYSNPSCAERHRISVGVVVNLQRTDSRGRESRVATDSSQHDALTAAASRGALLARSAASGQRIYAVHFPFPGLGKIEGRTDGFVWVP